VAQWVAQYTYSAGVRVHLQVDLQQYTCTASHPGLLHEMPGYHTKYHTVGWGGVGWGCLWGCLFGSESGRLLGQNVVFKKAVELDPHVAQFTEAHGGVDQHGACVEDCCFVWQGAVV